jgi:hypothetical protein
MTADIDTRGRTGGQKPKLGPRQVTLARQMYEETDDDGKRRYTVQQIANEFGVTRPPSTATSPSQQRQHPPQRPDQNQKLPISKFAPGRSYPSTGP